MAELFVDPNARHRLYVRDLGVVRFADSDDWFEIYERLPHRVRKEVERAGLRARMFFSSRAADGEASAEMDLAAGRRALLYHSIVAWSFCRAGVAVPVSEDVIDNLDDQLVEAMKDAVDAYYSASEMSADRKKSRAAALAGSGTQELEAGAAV